MKKAYAVLAFGALPFVSAHAHHSNTAAFTNVPVTIEGYVDRYLFVNPHVVLYVNVTDKKTGKTVRWMAEGPATTGLRLAGWTAKTLKHGDYVSITGNSGRNDRPMVDLHDVIIKDPKTGAVVATIKSDRRGVTPDDPNSPDFSYPKTLADGRPNLTGIWVQNTREPGFLLLKDPVFTPAGQAVQDTIQAVNDPQYTKCEPAGLIRQAGFTPHPVKITQYKDRVVFQYEEYAGKRTIYLDDREYKKFDAKSRYGFGRYKAHYEGDALVISTDLLNSAWSGIFGQVTSDQTTVVERYTRHFDPVWGPSVHLSMIVTDPVYLKEPRELFWDKFYTIKGFTGTERDNIQKDYVSLPVECQVPLTAGK